MPTGPRRTTFPWGKFDLGYLLNGRIERRGRRRVELAELAPRGIRRMGANPHANGGALLRDLELPDFPDYAAALLEPCVRRPGATRVLGLFLRDVTKLNQQQRNFRVDRMRRYPTVWAPCLR